MKYEKVNVGMIVMIKVTGVKAKIAGREYGEDNWLLLAVEHENSENNGFYVSTDFYFEGNGSSECQ